MISGITGTSTSQPSDSAPQDDPLAAAAAAGTPDPADVDLMNLFYDNMTKGIMRDIISHTRDLAKKAFGDE